MTNNNFFNGDDYNFSDWLERNAIYEGYSEWIYECEDDGDTYTIVAREDSDVDGYDISSEETGTMLVIGGSNFECYNFFN